MKHSIKFNYLLNMSYQCLTILIPLITTPYLSRVLGAEGIGANSYAMSMASYFTLFAIMGSGTYAQRKVAGYQSDKYKRSFVFWNVFFFRFLTTLLACIAYIGYVVGLKPQNVQIAWIYLIYVACVAVDVTWFFQGIEDFFTVVMRNLIIRLVNILSIFMFVKTANDLPLYCLSYVGLTMLANLSTLILLPKYVVKIPLREINPFNDFKDIFALFVPTIAIQVYTLLDKTMIGWFSIGSAENGYYNQTENMVKMCLMVITSLCTVMLPRMSKLFAEGNQKQFEYYLKKSYSFAWFLSIPMCFGLIGIATIFVPVFLGPGYDRSITLMYILSPIIIAISMSSITGNQLLLPSFLQKEYNLSVIVGACVNLIINLLLIPRCFSVGAAIGTLVAENVVTIVQFLICKKTNVLKFSSVFNGSWKYWLAGIIMFVVIITLKRTMSANVLSLVTLIGVGAIVYIGVLILMKDNLTFDFFRKLKNKI